MVPTAVFPLRSMVDLRPTPAAWRATLEELGVDNLVGATLTQAVEDAGVANEITPSTAGAAVAQLSQELASVDEALSRMIAVFERFGIATEALEAGDAEAAITIPR